MQKTAFKQDPILVVFSDGSQKAFGTCVYAIWGLSNGKYERHLIPAKGRRTAPVKKIFFMHLELKRAVPATQLCNFIKEEYRMKFEKEYYFIVDSQIVKVMLQKESYGFNTFFAVQIGVAQSTTDPRDWFGIK